MAAKRRRGPRPRPSAARNANLPEGHLAQSFPFVMAAKAAIHGMAPSAANHMQCAGTRRRPPSHPVLLCLAVLYRNIPLLALRDGPGLRHTGPTRRHTRSLMHALRSLALFAITCFALLATEAVAQSANPTAIKSAAQSRLPGAVVARCNIGKPSYCFKYGGSLCEKGNKKKNAKAECAKWTEGCMACHGAIPRCLDGTRTNVPLAKCEKCRTNWHTCMAQNDRKHWPNRMSGK